MEKGIILSNTFSIFLIALFASFDHNDAKTKSFIIVVNDDTISLISLVILFASLKVFSFFLNNRDNDNIEFSPTNIIPNFSTILFLIILLTLQPILYKDFIISGAELISLIMLFRSFSFMFKSF